MKSKRQNYRVMALKEMDLKDLEQMVLLKNQKLLEKLSNDKLPYELTMGLALGFKLMASAYQTNDDVKKRNVLVNIYKLMQHYDTNIVSN